MRSFCKATAEYFVERENVWANVTEILGLSVLLVECLLMTSKALQIANINHLNLFIISTSFCLFYRLQIYISSLSVSLQRSFREWTKICWSIRTPSSSALSTTTCLKRNSLKRSKCGATSSSCTTRAQLLAGARLHSPLRRRGTISWQKRGNGSFKLRQSHPSKLQRAE